jgi:methylation protein EvaC
MATNCLICEGVLEPFLSFGSMPIANGFLTPTEFDQEFFFDLGVAFCSACAMVQLTELVDRNRMFHESYAFYSSTSVRMSEHFRKFASWTMGGFLTAADPLVVELGSNDGIMLRHFASAGVRHLGVEPSENVATVAREHGIATRVAFFDEALAEEILEEQGPADAILGANVFCHIPYLHSVFKGVCRLLKPDGVLIFEDPYLGDILEKTSYDQIYDEHAFYFSLKSVSALAHQHDLEVIDASPQEVHGGSMRYVIARRGRRRASTSVRARLRWEGSMGLDRIESLHRFSERVERSAKALLDLVREARSRDRRVVGYGATSKSTTVINYCGLTPDDIEFISDTTPLKQGKFSPGAHIPVRPHAAFVTDYPDYALLFAWNHSGEIMAKEEGFRRRGGRWIVYVPEVEALS